MFKINSLLMQTAVRIKRTIIHDEMEIQYGAEANRLFEVRLASKNTDEFIVLKMTEQEVATIKIKIELYEQKVKPQP